MATLNTDPAITIIRDPRVYLVGRQEVNDEAISEFLADHPG